MLALPQQMKRNEHVQMDAGMEHRDGGPHDLKLAERPVPEAGEHDIIVRTLAVSLNYRDKLVLETGMGLDLAFPFVPASDMSGVVEAVGKSVTRFRPGDRVISTFAPGWLDGLRPGTGRTPAYETLGGAHPGVLSEYVVLLRAGSSQRRRASTRRRRVPCPVRG